MGLLIFHKPSLDRCKLLAYNCNMQPHKDKIRNSGLRVTGARVAVMEVLSQSERPLDIASIILEIAKKRVDADQATIYRIVENFVEKKLITRLQFQEKKFYYEIVGKDHHHAICTNCGKIEDISKCNIKRLEREIENTKNFQVTKHALEFYGLCSNCH